MKKETVGQMSLFDLDISFGKTYQEHLVPTVEKTSRQSSRKSSGSSSQKPPMCLYLTRESGANQDVCTIKWGGHGQLLGEYTTHSFGESPSEENVSRLSQILQDSAHQRFYLSARACAGILNRASKRGKELPEILKTALENQMNRNSDAENPSRL